MSRWYRAYAGTVRDDKLAECAVVAACSRSIVIATWHAILESAADTADGGRFDTSARRIAAILGEPMAVIDGVFFAMEEVGLIEGDTVPAWKRRQFESDSSTERSRKHREAKRNGDATLQQRSATPPEADTETEKIADAASARDDLESACLAIVAGTAWPVETAQDWHAIRRLITDEGLSLENEILPSIRQQAERAKARGKRVGTWGYFAPGCREFAAAARSPPPSVVPMPARSPNRHEPRHERRTDLQRALDNLRSRCDPDHPGDAGDALVIDAVAIR